MIVVKKIVLNDVWNRITTEFHLEDARGHRQ